MRSHQRVDRTRRSWTRKTFINVQSRAEGSEVGVTQLRNSTAVVSKQDTRAPENVTTPHREVIPLSDTEPQPPRAVFDL